MKSNEKPPDYFISSIRQKLNFKNQTGHINDYWSNIKLSMYNIMEHLRHDTIIYEFLYTVCTRDGNKFVLHIPYYVYFKLRITYILHT